MRCFTCLVGGGFLGDAFHDTWRNYSNGAIFRRAFRWAVALVPPEYRSGEHVAVSPPWVKPAQATATVPPNLVTLLRFFGF